MKKGTHSISDVADALGVPRSTLMSWIELDYMAFFDQDQLGRDDIAFTAAFAAIAALVGAADAAQIMRQVVDEQPRYWTKALDVAISRKAEVYILIKRYDYNGIGQLEAAVRIGGDLRQELAIFGDATHRGERTSDSAGIADEIGSEVHEIHEVHVLPKTAALPVGDHIATALRVLRSL